MKIVAPGLSIISLTSDTVTAGTPARQKALLLVHSGGSRYSFQADPCGSNNSKGSLRLVFHPTTDEKAVCEVRWRTTPSRSLRNRGWKRLKVEGSRGHAFSAYRLYVNDRGQQPRDVVILLEKPDTANFLSRIPDDTPLGDITLPGTHESCAMYGYPISQCQQPATPIEQQLLDGVRFLDVRLRVVGDELLMYHGPRPQRSTLAQLLIVLHQFLDTHPSETLILSIKQETPPWHPHFSQILYQAFLPFLDKWFLEERIPTLGEVRGKGMLLTRFDRDKDGDMSWENGMGIHPYTWPDSRKEGFEWDCAGTIVRTQDWYRVHTFLEIPEKFNAITTHLLPTLDSPSSCRTFTLSYLSASYFPLSLPTIIAKGFGWPSWGLGVEGINSRMFRWLLERFADGQRVRACLAIDFYRQCAGDAGLAELLIQMNFIGEDDL
ncbi:uncharacterized protein I303_100941 [Kwoniella dejecticola CBS 10117]|uniref:Phosphatidylinositol-specific phospholipase C X domain-containing protein n=1 Tax=Kwoniella dejecticola CBS 10117 TaxID=1296121 RepID=A0A1A6AGH0_9TREE|nr:uncharacterized protein I303_00945 [Kwoniella dejecticola CBS 10117]OBR89123.1 hypothetical protein I303_00945 [Kwoniella dejecticola CBS 10117]